MKKIKMHVKDNLGKWMISLLTGLFLFIALFVYKAYDIDEVEAYSGHSLFSRVLIQAFSTSLVFFIFHFYVYNFLNINEKAKDLVINALATLVGLNVTFLLFNYFYNWTELYWPSYVNFLYEYPLVVVFPILIGHLTGKIYKQKTVPPPAMLTFSSENGKQSISLKAENFLFLKSADNYIEVCFSNGSEVKKELLRNTLKKIEQAYAQSPYVKRCHRSYLVNPMNIQVASLSNPKSLTLMVNQIEIPVSGKYLNDFK